MQVLRLGYDSTWFDHILVIDVVSSSQSERTKKKTQLEVVNALMNDT